MAAVPVHVRIEARRVAALVALAVHDRAQQRAGAAARVDVGVVGHDAAVREKTGRGRTGCDGRGK